MNTTLKLQNYPKLLRRLSSKASWTEINVPVPWGHVAGKWWGPKHKQPILVLHGWQDNCGSFDRLIPMLNPKHGYLAIDFPGHGLSSHLPVGTSYNWLDYVITVRRLVKHFKWSKPSILGHSIGGATGYYYECLYPGELNFLISIDALQPITSDLPFGAHGRSIDVLIKYDQLISQGKEGPVHTKEDLIEKLHEDSAKSIDLNVCEYVLERNIEESKVSPNKYYFTRDMRLKVLPLLYTSQRDIINNVNNLLCPILYFKADNSSPRYIRLTDTTTVTEILNKTKKYFEMHVVEGTHHVHLNSPEILQGRINDFLERHADEEN